MCFKKLYHKKITEICSIVLLTLFSWSVNSAPLWFEPVIKILPDGASLNLFVSGDEFFNYLHDSNGFPVGSGDDGYYYYLIQEDDNFIVSNFRAGSGDPFKISGLKTVTIPSFVNSKREAFYRDMEDRNKTKDIKSLEKSSGILNNLVIYIRFKDEGDFNVSRETYETRLNNTTNISLRNYFDLVSYKKLQIVSYHSPGNAKTNLYYTDSFSRSYYKPYNSATNTSGYKNDAEKTQREHSLLANAIRWISSNYTLPSDVDFDRNKDKVFDNISFIVKGTADGWNDLLWPHRWALYSQTVVLGGLRAYGYTFQLENVSVITFAHEMFHTLGAPDLYHYNNNLRPVGPWDIMAEGKGHPGAWMKHKYGGWIDKIPEITASGTYVLKPLSQDKKNAYKILSPYRNDQYFIVEYRKREGFYESDLPSSGMIIQRINPSNTGNASGPPDEIYVFRLNGTTDSEGDINQAPLSNISGRTSFTDDTNPRAFFSNGNVTGIDISSVRIEGDSMLFTVNIDIPVELVLTPGEDTRISARWKSLSQNDFLVAVSTTTETITPSVNKNYQPGDTIGSYGFIVQNGPAKEVIMTGLISDETYYFTVWTITGKAPSAFSTPVMASQRTGIYTILDLPHVEKFDYMNTILPRGWKAKAGKEGWELYQTDDLLSPGSILLLNPSQGTEEWIYSPGFQLLKNKKYMITFRYRNKTNTMKESFYLGGGTTRNNNGLKQYSLFAAVDFNHKDYSLYKSLIFPAASTTYYFGFKTGVISQGVIFDDFRIETVPSNTVLHFKPEEFYPNPTTGKIFIPATERTEIIIYRLDGAKKYEKVIDSMQEIDISSVGKGMFLIRFNTSSGSSTGKIFII